uniref:Putative serine protease with signal anchor n=1 Tax=Ixodes ricinus TaxID=34613 RepID=A0A0K8R4N9_IXORI
MWILDCPQSWFYICVVCTACYRMLRFSVDTSSRNEEGLARHNWSCGRRQRKSTFRKESSMAVKRCTVIGHGLLGSTTRAQAYTSAEGFSVSERIVLTAAHCVMDLEAATIMVLLGTSKKPKSVIPGSIAISWSNESYDDYEFDNSTYVYVDKFETSQDVQRVDLQDPEGVHMEVEDICVTLQDSDCTAMPRDIAILKLKENVTFTDYIQPICLPEECEEPPNDTAIYVAGWGEAFVQMELESYDDYSSSYQEGESENDNTEVSTNKTWKLVYTRSLDLMQAQVKYISLEECRKISNRSLPDYTVCSKLEEGGICYGDSGGPLMFEKDDQWFLDALAVSSPLGCIYDNHPYPYHYLRVSYFTQTFIHPYLRSLRQTGGDTSSLCANRSALRECFQLFFEEEENAKFNRNKKQAS